MNKSAYKLIYLLLYMTFYYATAPDAHITKDPDYVQEQMALDVLEWAPTESKV